MSNDKISIIEEDVNNLKKKVELKFSNLEKDKQNFNANLNESLNKLTSYLGELINDVNDKYKKLDLYVSAIVKLLTEKQILDGNEIVKKTISFAKNKDINKLLLTYKEALTNLDDEDMSIEINKIFNNLNIDVSDIDYDMIGLSNVIDPNKNNILRIIENLKELSK